MRRAKIWMAAALLTATTAGLTVAGPFSFGKGKKDAESARQAAPQGDQDLADAIKNKCQKSGLARRGNDIGIEVRGGVAVISGKVTSREDAVAALEAANSVGGIRRVENRLSVVAPKAEVAAKARPSKIQQTSATATRRGGVEMANYQDQPADVTEAPAEVEAMPIPPMGPGMAPQGPGMPPPGYGMPQGAMAQYPPMPMGAPGYGMGQASQVAYDQPSMPNHAWPTYAQYPNYAAVTYPKQYSASAFPYIGPFYPYPQVPLGWRKATLEWDDGFWNLNFNSRTDRWWWFMDYRNW
jgi:hypothetical protein